MHIAGTPAGRDALHHVYAGYFLTFDLIKRNKQHIAKCFDGVGRPNFVSPMRQRGLLGSCRIQRQILCTKDDPVYSSVKLASLALRVSGRREAIADRV